MSAERRGASAAAAVASETPGDTEWAKRFLDLVTKDDAGPGAAHTPKHARRPTGRPASGPGSGAPSAPFGGSERKRKRKREQP
jgi:hypothetical protein